jgi:hypothetical protein
MSMSDDGPRHAQPLPWEPAAAEKSRREEALATADEQFFDDLLAAHRFKTFLVSTGVEVPVEVSKGIAELLEKFAGREHEQSAKADAAIVARALDPG